MKVLLKRVTKENLDEAIFLCKRYAKEHNEKYELSSELLDLIIKDKLIIHVYTDNTFEFKRIRKLSDEEKARIKPYYKKMSNLPQGKPMRFPAPKYYENKELNNE